MRTRTSIIYNPVTPIYHSHYAKIMVLKVYHTQCIMNGVCHYVQHLWLHVLV